MVKKKGKWKKTGQSRFRRRAIDPTLWLLLEIWRWRSSKDPLLVIFRPKNHKWCCWKRWQMCWINWSIIVLRQQIKADQLERLPKGKPRRIKCCYSFRWVFQDIGPISVLKLIRIFHSAIIKLRGKHVPGIQRRFRIWNERCVCFRITPTESKQIHSILQLSSWGRWRRIWFQFSLC